MEARADAHPPVQGDGALSTLPPLCSWGGFWSLGCNGGNLVPPVPTQSRECGGDTAVGTAAACGQRWSAVWGSHRPWCPHGRHDNGQTPRPSPPAQDQPASFRTPRGPLAPIVALALTTAAVRARTPVLRRRRALPSGSSICWYLRQRQRRRGLPAAPYNVPRFLYFCAGACQHSSMESGSVRVAREAEVTASSALAGAITQEGVSAMHPVGTVIDGHHGSGTQ